MAVCDVIQTDDRVEHITRANSPDIQEFAPGIEGLVLVGEQFGSIDLCTVLATLKPIAQRTYHRHAFSEVITPLEGRVVVLIEGRRYELRPLESIHIPAGKAHTAYNPSNACKSLVHSSFACAKPTREFVRKWFPIRDRDFQSPREDDPEYVARNDAVELYSLGEGASFRDLFSSRFGSKGICGGYAEFEPGGSLPCHVHEYDESITIVKGTAICEVSGKRYTLSDNDTALVPRGRPHRFLNVSREIMAMVWVYAGNEPERTLKEPGYCIGMDHCPCPNCNKAQCQ